MSSSRPWWQSITLSSPELDTLSAQYNHLCEPIREEPGWFAVRDNVKVNFQGRLLEPGDRSIYFSLFDPDIRGLPFHRTAAFLAIPYYIRFAFLFRNPHCIDALLRFFKASHTLAIRRSTEGRLIRAGREGESLLNAESELRDRFGIRPIWIYEGVFLDPPILSLEEAFPADLPTIGRSERERRSFRKALAARRRAGGIRAPRRESDTFYKRLLAVWDAREGWLDQPSQGYDPERAQSLQRAVAQAGAGSCVKDYYHAFRLVTGMEYSKEAWLANLGICWLRCSSDAIRRRGIGRKRGASAPKDERVVHFLRLLQNGIGIEEAGRAAGLSEQVIRFLAKPDNWDAVREFMQCPERVSELFASL